MSGNFALMEKLGDWFSYDRTPRARSTTTTSIQVLMATFGQDFCPRCPQSYKDGRDDQADEVIHSFCSSMKLPSPLLTLPSPCTLLPGTTITPKILYPPVTAPQLTGTSLSQTRYSSSSSRLILFYYSQLSTAIGSAQPNLVQNTDHDPSILQ